MCEQKEIKEFIYFDLEKALSIYSQLEDGLIQEEKVGSVKGEALHPEFGVNLFGLNAGLGGEKSSSHQKFLSKVLHHNVLNRLENSLSSVNLLTDLNKISAKDQDTILSEIEGASYIKASGPSTFENLRRLNRMLPDINKTIDFLNECRASGVPTAKELMTSGVSKADAQKQIAVMKQAIRNDIVARLDDKMLKGMVKFFKDYLEERIVFRSQPFDSCKEVQVRAQLKDSCFLTDDEDHLSFSYGLNPKMDITVIGLITSMPAKDESLNHQFDPTINIDGDMGAMEEKLRNFIEAFENLKSMVSFDRYPVITVYPVAIYRSIPYKTKSQEKD